MFGLKQTVASKLLPEILYFNFICFQYGLFFFLIPFIKNKLTYIKTTQKCTLQYSFIKILYILSVRIKTI